MQDLVFVQRVKQLPDTKHDRSERVVDVLWPDSSRAKQQGCSPKISQLLQSQFGKVHDRITRDIEQHERSGLLQLLRRFVTCEFHGSDPGTTLAHQLMKVIQFETSESISQPALGERATPLKSLCAFDHLTSICQLPCFQSVVLLSCPQATWRCSGPSLVNAH